MTDSPQPPSQPPRSVSEDRLESWKEIAAYLRRDVKTVQRWEKREGMPVHRHLHDKLGSVSAFKSELDAWTQNRRMPSPQGPTPAAPTRRAPIWWTLAAIAIAVAVIGAFVFRRERTDVRDPLANARFVQLTDFNGVEQAAAISRDGRFVAFLSDRDGQTDVWVTQVGSGEFHNLTRGAAGELINPSVRTLDFSPDGSLVTFWTRRLNASGRSEIGIWAIPVVGGAPRLYLDGVAEHRWSDDGARMVYHTPGPGDPMFVRDGSDQSSGRQIFVGPAGLHDHFVCWSPDGAFVYFVQGGVNDRMDIWRIEPSGGTPERITYHNTAVTHPVFLDPRRLLYLATDRDRSGPWIYSIDVERRRAERASAGIDRFTSLSGSRDGRRLVATHATPRRTLWRVSLGAEPATSADARALTLTTGNGSSPRFGNGFLLYVSSTGTGDSIWKLLGGSANQVWTAPDMRVVGPPALSRDGQQVAFSTRGGDGNTRLWIVNIDGTSARTIPVSFELQGAPAWAPDGRSVTIGGVVDGVPNLFAVPRDGNPPARLLTDQSSDPAWSPDGTLLLFSGADVGTTFRLKAVDAQGGHPREIPELTLTRGGRRVVFIAGKPSLVFMRGDMRHKDLWMVDLDTGAERQLTSFAPGFDIRDFDITPDGRELIVEQVQEHSNIVLLELPQ